MDCDFIFVKKDELFNGQCKDCIFFEEKEFEKDKHFCLNSSQYYPCLTRRDTDACKSFILKKKS